MKNEAYRNSMFAIKRIGISTALLGLFAFTACEAAGNQNNLIEQCNTVSITALQGVDKIPNEFVTVEQCTDYDSTTTTPTSLYVFTRISTRRLLNPINNPKDSTDDIVEVHPYSTRKTAKLYAGKHNNQECSVIISLSERRVTSIGNEVCK